MTILDLDEDRETFWKNKGSLEIEDCFRKILKNDLTFTDNKKAEWGEIKTHEKIDSESEEVEYEEDLS